MGYPSSSFFILISRHFFFPIDPSGSPSLPSVGEGSEMLARLCILLEAEYALTKGLDAPLCKIFHH